MKPHIPFNIMFVGDPVVGKSTLINTFKETEYKRTQYIETVGLMLIHDQIEFSNYVADITFWDTAGQETYKKPTYNYLKMRKIDAVALIYDLSRPHTLRSAINWYNQIQHIGREIFIAFVGNKIDLPYDDNVIMDMIEKYNDHGKTYNYFVSAITYNGIKQSFFDIVYQGLYYKLTKKMEITET